MQSIPLRAFMGAIVAIAILAAASVSALAQTFATETLTVRTSGGASHVFTVELATTSDQRALGLMNRDMMAADHGMLFDFGESRFVYMWMKNTHLPLDMLFVRQDGTIVRVAAEAHHDSSTEDDRWDCVDIEAVEPLPKPVTLDQVKADPALKDMALVRLSRLSVQPVTAAEWKRVCKMGGLS